MIRHVVMDMDGVLYRGDEPIPGAIETIDALHRQGVQIAYLTNNASRHREELAEKLSRLGFPCDLKQMWGSAYTTAYYLAQEAPHARIFVVGSSGMVREMQDAGLTVVPTHEGATHVVAGLDRDITYDKLTQAHYAICNGRRLLPRTWMRHFRILSPRHLLGRVPLSRFSAHRRTCNRK